MATKRGYKQQNCDLPMSLWERLDDAAAEESIDKTELVVRAVALYLANQELQRGKPFQPNPKRLLAEQREELQPGAKPPDQTGSA